MFLAHSFRLRDPWQCEALEGGGVRWSRGFHRPTGLEDDDALWLVCSGLPPGVTVAVNGQFLSPCATGVPPVPPHQYDVTTLLTGTNHVEILIPSDQPLTARHGESPAETDSRKPSPAFPFDVRLGVVGHS